MTAGTVLALSGSNVTGDAPFSCALRLRGAVHEARSPAGQRGDLAALVDAVCRAHGVRPADLTELRLDLGPGSYTGLRVAVTFVRFLQRFGGVPVLATDSLSLLATAALGAGTRLRPLLDARRERFHTALLAATPGLGVLEAPTALPLGEVLARAAAGDTFVVPAAVAAQHGDALRATGAALLVATGVAARDLFRAELPLLAATAAELEPKYLMGSYAE
ncbi:MAG: tRNA (adenosine(37)-N6)-threonylcarbamoyltransferase complex dimerization subunit type 1 TsaB [Planctomycetes bacterium]|nr:tRNA (adenosine(37)-N6)-threonylcarbamoyltransferase complex dimerization subunit type 1 TsaB [Planctomycetota bacterium]